MKISRSTIASGGWLWSSRNLFIFNTNTTVFENVASGLRFRNILREKIKVAIEKNLDRFGI